MPTDVVDDEDPDAPEAEGENEDKRGNVPEGMPNQPKPLGMMVAFLPSDIELEQIAVDGGLDSDDLHLTLRYYGEVTDPDFIEDVHDAARTIAGNVQPFVVSVTGRRQLGQADPPADVLILNDHKAFRLALAKLPPSDKDYPAFTPHITVGYGIGDDALARSNPDNEVLFDHIVVGRGNDDWTVYQLGDLPPVDEVSEELAKVEDLPMPEPLDSGDNEATADAEDPNEDEERKRGGITAALGYTFDELLAFARNPDLLYTDFEDIPLPPVTAGIDDVIEGKVNAPGSRAKSKTVGKLDPRPSGSKQKCFHGSPATCKSVKWIAVYTALREKRGFSKAKAAAIANSMHSKWRRGQPNRPGQRPMIRKTI